VNTNLPSVVKADVPWLNSKPAPPTTLSIFNPASHPGLLCIPREIYEPVTTYVKYAMPNLATEALPRAAFLCRQCSTSLSEHLSVWKQKVYTSLPYDMVTVTTITTLIDLMWRISKTETSCRVEQFGSKSLDSAQLTSACEIIQRESHTAHA
jgi:hypothetical protein